MIIAQEDGSKIIICDYCLGDKKANAKFLGKDVCGACFSRQNRCVDDILREQMIERLYNQE